MPNRIIREAIITSERVNQLDSDAEVFYRRLLSKVDDHGLYDARLSILRSSLYPLRLTQVREADCSRWISMCVKAGLIVLYQVGGKPYLKILDTRWQLRSEPRYPAPTEEQMRSTEGNCEQMLSPDINCDQMRTKTLSLSETLSLACAEEKRTRPPVEKASGCNKPHLFRDSPYFDPFALSEKLSDWPEDRVMHYHEDMLTASDSKGLKYLDWSAVAVQWYLRDSKGRQKR